MRGCQRNRVRLRFPGSFQFFLIELQSHGGSGESTVALQKGRKGVFQPRQHLGADDIADIFGRSFIANSGDENVKSFVSSPRNPCITVTRFQFASKRCPIRSDDGQMGRLNNSVIVSCVQQSDYCFTRFLPVHAVSVVSDHSWTGLDRQRPIRSIRDTRKVVGLKLKQRNVINGPKQSGRPGRG